MIIEISNFQKIKYAKIEVNGYTVITGESARGKSCLIRALRAALLGKSHEKNISHGENSASVSVDLGDRKVLWERTPATQVSVDGISYTRVSKNYNELVTEPLGILNIDVGQKEVTPQISTQLRPLFLVLETPSVVSKAFQVISEVDKINEAVQRVKKDLRDLASDLKIRNKDKERVKEKIGVYEPIEKLYSDIDSIKNKLNLLKETSDRVNEIQKNINRVKSLEYIPDSFVPDKLKPIVNVTPYYKKLKNIFRFKRLRKLPNKIKVVDLNLKLEDTLILSKIERVRELSFRVSKGQEVIKVHKEKIEKFDDNIERLKKYLKVCPTCNRQFHET